MNLSSKSSVTTVIDAARCTGCGLCLAVCPDETISMEEGAAQVTGTRCMQCGHCMAACPEDAIRIGALERSGPDFETFEVADRWMPYGIFDTAELVRLMRSRRSCRNFKADAVDPRLLRDLVKVGITAPSGTNSQRWTFTILPDRQAVFQFGENIARFFESLNRKAQNSMLRWVLRLIGKPELARYYQEYYPTVRQGLQDWKDSGRDRLFHGATAAIVAGSRAGASCPMEDVMLATQNILLAAHTMGLGTCLIGYAVAAMSKDASIKLAVGIPREEAVYSVIALGIPDETYQRPAGRKSPLVRVGNTGIASAADPKPRSNR